MNKFYCVILLLGFVVAFVWTAPQNSPDTVVELTSVAPNASSTLAKPFGIVVISFYIFKL